MNTPMLGVCSGWLKTLPLTLAGRSLIKKQFVSVLNSLIMPWLHVLCPALSSLTSFYSMGFTAMGVFGFYQYSIDGLKDLRPVQSLLSCGRRQYVDIKNWATENRQIWQLHFPVFEDLDCIKWSRRTAH
jgi:hypothetical protein